jgi:hypothetical protein
MYLLLFNTETAFFQMVWEVESAFKDFTSSGGRMGEEEGANLTISVDEYPQHRSTIFR